MVAVVKFEMKRERRDGCYCYVFHRFIVIVLPKGRRMSVCRHLSRLVTVRGTEGRKETTTNPSLNKYE